MRRSNFRGARDGADVANLNVQTYVDARLVASIGKFLLEHGQIAQTQYGRISTYCMRYFMQMLEDHYPEEVKRFEDTSEAINWLGANGFSLAQFKAGVNNRLINTIKMEHTQQDSLGGFFTPDVVPRQTHQVADTSLSFLGEDKDDILKQLEQAMIRGEKIAHDNDPKNIAHMAETQARVDKIMPEWIAQNEARTAPVSEEVRTQNLRNSLVLILLKNATSSQQMPIPKEVQHLLEDPEILAEVETKMQPYLEQRERDMIQAERDKQKRIEETARRQV